MLATCGADGWLKVFDIRTQTAARPVQAFRASETEVLSCDWNKYDLSTLATGGKDMGVKVWDMRSGRSECTTDLRGHTLAVRKVQCVRHAYQLSIPADVTVDGHHIIVISSPPHLTT